MQPRTSLCKTAESVDCRQSTPQMLPQHAAAPKGGARAACNSAEGLSWPFVRATWASVTIIFPATLMFANCIFFRNPMHYKVNFLLPPPTQNHFLSACLLLVAPLPTLARMPHGSDLTRHYKVLTACYICNVRRASPQWPRLFLLVLRQHGLERVT